MAEHKQPVVVLPGGRNKGDREARLAYLCKRSERNEQVEESFPTRIKNANDCPAVADDYARHEGLS